MAAVITPDQMVPTVVPNVGLDPDRYDFITAVAAELFESSGTIVSVVAVPPLFAVERLIKKKRLPLAAPTPPTSYERWISNIFTVVEAEPVKIIMSVADVSGVNAPFVFAEKVLLVGVEIVAETVESLAIATRWVPEFAAPFPVATVLPSTCVRFEVTLPPPPPPPPPPPLAITERKPLTVIVPEPYDEIRALN
jgi:hypothetical protein